MWSLRFWCFPIQLLERFSCMLVCQLVCELKRWWQHKACPWGGEDEIEAKVGTEKTFGKWLKDCVSTHFLHKWFLNLWQSLNPSSAEILLKVQGVRHMKAYLVHWEGTRMSCKFPTSSPISNPTEALEVTVQQLTQNEIKGYIHIVAKKNWMCAYSLNYCVIGDHWR